MFIIRFIFICDCVLYSHLIRPFLIHFCYITYLYIYIYILYIVDNVSIYFSIKLYLQLDFSFHIFYKFKY